MHRSHRRDEDGRPGHNRDSPDIDRHWDKDRKRQHCSRSRDRHNKRRRTVSPEDRDRGRYGGRDGRGPAGNRPPPAPLLDKPERGGVHKGRVSGLMDFGCFVELQGFKSRVEGLVHITNLPKTRYNQLQVCLLADSALDLLYLSHSSWLCFWMTCCNATLTLPIVPVKLVQMQHDVQHLHTVKDQQ